MFIELTTTDILIALVCGLTFSLVAACFDVYLIRRHRSTAKAAYLTRIEDPQASRLR